MTRARYRYGFGHDWLSRPWAKLICGLVGAAAVGAGVYFLIDELNGGEGRLWLLIFNLFLYGPALLLSAFGLSERYLSSFVEVGLGHVRWRLPEEGVLWPRYCSVSLARVHAMNVGLLHVDFEMVDGRRHRLPLGALPYEVVQEVKRRFEGRSSLAAAAGGALVLAR